MSVKVLGQKLGGEGGGLGDFGPPDETTGDFDVLQVERSDEMGKDKTEQKDRELVYDMFRSVEGSAAQMVIEERIDLIFFRENAERLLLLDFLDEQVNGTRSSFMVNEYTVSST